MSKKNKGGNVLPRPNNQVIFGAQYSGPLPTPTHLEHYERILPGAAERILKMAENQASHRQSLETKVIDSDIRNSFVGLIFGFIIGLVGVGSGFYLIYTGKILEGSIFGGATIAALVSTFIYGSQQRRKERQGKQQ